MTNPYAIEDEGEIVTRHAEWPMVCVQFVAMILVVALGSTVLIMAIYGLIHVTEGTQQPPQPKFLYGDRVSVVSGIYRGEQGSIAGGSWDEFDLQYEYRVEFDSGAYDLFMPETYIQK